MSSNLQGLFLQGKTEVNEFCYLSSVLLSDGKDDLESAEKISFFTSIKSPKVVGFPKKICKSYENIKILVAEDDKIIKAFWKKFLCDKKFFGFSEKNLIIVSTGSEAFKETEKNQYDLILMDLQMKNDAEVDAYNKLHGQDKHSGEYAIERILSSHSNKCRDSVILIQSGENPIVIKSIVKKMTLKHEIEEEEYQAYILNKEKILIYANFTKIRDYIVTPKLTPEGLKRRLRRGASMSDINASNLLPACPEKAKSICYQFNKNKKAKNEEEIILRIHDDIDEEIMLRIHSDPAEHAATTAGSNFSI